MIFLAGPQGSAKREMGEDWDEGKNGNVLLNVSNDHKHINHRELRLLLGKWIRHCYEGESCAWGMKEGVEEQKKWGNEGNARRLKQHCTAGRPLGLYHHSLTITDTSQQRISLDNQPSMRDTFSPNLILLHYSIIQPYMSLSIALLQCHCRTAAGTFSSSQPCVSLANREWAAGTAQPHWCHWSQSGDQQQIDHD